MNNSLKYIRTDCPILKGSDILPITLQTKKCDGNTHGHSKIYVWSQGHGQFWGTVMLSQCVFGSHKL